MVTTLFWLGLVAIGMAIAAVVLPDRQRAQAIKATAKKHIALERIAVIWTKQGQDLGSLNVEDLARVWKSPPPAPVGGGEVESEPWKHAEIHDFYNCRISGKPWSSSTAGIVIIELLRVLDKEGDCPSVVDGLEEPEAKLEKTSLDVLRRIPLYAHTLRVADKMLDTDAGGPGIAKPLIAALAHDLGKLKKYSKTGYSLGDHPLISVQALESLPGFKTLAFANAVLEAVRDHHGRPRDPFSRKLRDADQAARRAELSDWLQRQAPAPISEASASASDVPVSVDCPPAASKLLRLPEEKADFDKPREEKLPWLNLPHLLYQIKPRINKMEGGRWVAFSMRNGYVYVQPKIIFELVRQMAQATGDGLLSIAEGDQSVRRDILFTVVNKLRGYGAIAEDLIRPSYFGGKFVLVMRNGRELKGYYTPFMSSAFCEFVSELEAFKQGAIKDIQSVEIDGGETS